MGLVLLDESVVGSSWVPHVIANNPWYLLQLIFKKLVEIREVQAKPQNFHAPSFIDGNNPQKMLDHLLSTNHRSGLTLCFPPPKKKESGKWCGPFVSSLETLAETLTGKIFKIDPELQSRFCYPTSVGIKTASLDLRNANIILDELRSSLAWFSMPELW